MHPAAAIMAALGHAPFESVVCLLIMTTCVGPFGSSGIGLWFGLSGAAGRGREFVTVEVTYLQTWQQQPAACAWLGLSVPGCAVLAPTCPRTLPAALDWSRAQLVHVTFLVAVCMTAMSFPIAWLGARFLLSWRDVRGCWLFCLLSVAACAVPMLLASLFRWGAPRMCVRARRLAWVRSKRSAAQNAGLRCPRHPGSQAPNVFAMVPQAS